MYNPKIESERAQSLFVFAVSFYVSLSLFVKSPRILDMIIAYVDMYTLTS